MSDLIDDPRLGENAPEFTVSEISGDVKRTLESEFGRIRVKGEVGRVVQARSGHMYFDVKDERNALACNLERASVKTLSPTRGGYGGGCKWQNDLFWWAVQI